MLGINRVWQRTKASMLSALRTSFTVGTHFTSCAVCVFALFIAVLDCPSVSAQNRSAVKECLIEYGISDKNPTDIAVYDTIGPGSYVLISKFKNKDENVAINLEQAVASCDLYMRSFDYIRYRRLCDDSDAKNCLQSGRFIAGISDISLDGIDHINDHEMIEHWVKYKVFNGRPAIDNSLIILSTSDEQTDTFNAEVDTIQDVCSDVSQWGAGNHVHGIVRLSSGIKNISITEWYINNPMAIGVTKILDKDRRCLFSVSINIDSKP